MGREEKWTAEEGGWSEEEERKRGVEGAEGMEGGLRRAGRGSGGEREWMREGCVCV